MQSAPEVDLVHQAILTLYQAGDLVAKESASIWLGEFQKSIHAWQISDRLLQEKRDLESCYFGAQTMRTKIQYSFHELPTDSYFSLRDSLMNHLSHCDTQTNQAIVTQLCLALADLALQVPTWKSVVLDVIQRYTQNPNHVVVLIELLTVIPEEVHRRTLRLGANRRDEICKELQEQAPAVLDIVSKLTEASGQNADILARIFKCLGSWFTIGSLPCDQMAGHPLIQGLFTILSNPNSSSSLHEAATDCMVEALVAVETANRNSPLAHTLFNGIHMLKDAWLVSVSTEDNDKLTNFCRLFTELAECFLMVMIDSPGQGLGSLQTLDLLLSAISYHDYALAEMTFNFWYRLSEIVYQTDSAALTDMFKPYIERLLYSLCNHCRFDADHEGLPEHNEEFCDFRRQVTECIRDVVFIVSSTECFRQMYDLLKHSSSKNASWEELEAPLFVMVAVAKNIIPDEEEVVPEVVNAVLQLPQSIHVCLRHTSVSLLGELKDWIEAHPEIIERTFNFLLDTLRIPSLTNVSAVGIEAIASQCRQKLVPQFPVMLNVATSSNALKLSNTAAVGLLKATATVMSDLAAQELTQRFRELCHMQAKPLADILQQNTVEKQLQVDQDPVTWLDRLAAIFRHISPQVENGHIHPCLPVVQEVWPILSQTFDRYPANVRVMEHTCRCIRFAIRCLGTQSHTLLQPLVTQMVQIYSAHPHSCFLYLGSILVDEYGGFEACISGLLQMTKEFLAPTVKLLEEPNGLRNHPDTVDDLFRLALRFVQKAPGAFFTSDLYRPLFQCAINSVSIDHKEANQSVVKFLVEILEFIKVGRKAQQMHPVVGAAEIVFVELSTQLVQDVVCASVFCLPSMLLREMSEVLFMMGQISPQDFAVALLAALQVVSQRTAAGCAQATPEQMHTFHQNVVTAKDLKTVSAELKDFVRLFR